MNQLDILIPFSLPPAEMATDLFRELNMPAFATLISRTRSASLGRTETFDGFQRALPHETWLARRFGVAAPGANTSPPIAYALMRSLGIEADTGTWFVVQPVHIHIARDHLVLTDPKQLAASEPESRTLFDIAQPLFEEAGKVLKYGNASHWFVRADDWSGLQTATPDAAFGHNIDIWMPKGAGERDWRKVQNDVQMHWFNHSINAQRESSGRKTVNSLWLWGGSPAAEMLSETYDCAFNLDGWLTAFSQCVPRHTTAANAGEFFAAGPSHSLLVLDTLLEAALASDWAIWLERMRTLETEWFMPLLHGLKSGRLDEVTFVLTHDTHISRFTATRSSLRKFWVKPTLTTLCP
ncbi:MAG TPA: hypothetical protein VGE12_13150 [Noviherbaspirillum sp.]